MGQRGFFQPYQAHNGPVGPMELGACCLSYDSGWRTPPQSHWEGCDRGAYTTTNRNTTTLPPATRDSGQGSLAGGKIPREATTKVAAKQAGQQLLFTESQLSTLKVDAVREVTNQAMDMVKTHTSMMQTWSANYCQTYFDQRTGQLSIPCISLTYVLHIPYMWFLVLLHMTVCWSKPVMHFVPGPVVFCDKPDIWIIYPWIWRAFRCKGISVCVASNSG